ncbi:Replicative DNA helicase [bioreactor metagenome]|uniref:DNA 5'-3' helicase n=1 Tax=bioreactor metagenome TaxID=1076179 RepID=A0A644YEY2_9ZZZZ
MEEGKDKKNTKRSVKPVSMKASAFDHGRVPPQAVELEEVILGALMLEQNALNTVIDIIQPDSFYKEAHRYIFEAIQKLFARSSPIDMLTVIEELKKEGKLELVGGAYYITYLTNRVVSSANIEYHARIVAQKYIQRRLIEISTEIINDSFEESTDVFDLLDSAEDKLFKINEENLRRKTNGMAQLLRSARDMVETASKNENSLSGVPSGFKSLDGVTAGWQRSDLIILAARPGMGKTAFVLSMARNMALDMEVPVALFSLEMSAIQLVMRLIASEAKISSERLRTGKLTSQEWKSLNDNMDNLSKAKLYIDDTPALSVFELRAKARRLKQQYNIQCIVIDYLQLMTSKVDKNANREVEIATISRSLKALAKELDIPVICLSQLSREVEKRPGSKRPQLSDLRESGAIEQDADIVMFIYRPEYYFKEDDKTTDIESIRNKAELIIEKHRNGPLTTINLKFLGAFARFYDEDDTNFSSAIRLLSETGYSSAGSSITMQSRMNNDETGDDFSIRHGDL